MFGDEVRGTQKGASPTPRSSARRRLCKIHTPMEDVDVTDADMEDPELLAELAAITGEAPRKPKPKPKPNPVANPVPNLAEQKQALEVQLIAKKKEALAFKKEGDKSKAVIAMREAKTIEAGIRGSGIGHNVSHSFTWTATASAAAAGAAASDCRRCRCLRSRFDIRRDERCRHRCRHGRPRAPCRARPNHRSAAGTAAAAA